MEYKDKDISQSLNAKVEAIDGIEPPTPEFGYFKAMVDRQQAIIRRAQRIQLVLFIAVAFALVSALILMAGQYQVLFLALQGAAFTGTVMGLVLYSLKTRRQTGGAH